MKALKLRLDDELYERFKRLHPNYGEESRVFREVIEQYVAQQEKFLYQIHSRDNDDAPDTL